MKPRTSVLCVLFAISLTSTTAAAAQSGHGSAEDFELVCRATGGEWIDQPPGSPITACCANDGCVICDENGNECEHDPPYSRPSGASMMLPNPPQVITPVIPQPVDAVRPRLLILD